jgi:hypothetical protein
VLALQPRTLSSFACSTQLELVTLHCEFVLLQASSGIVSTWQHAARVQRALPSCSQGPDSQPWTWIAALAQAASTARIRTAMHGRILPALTGSHPQPCQHPAEHTTATHTTATHSPPTLPLAQPPLPPRPRARPRWRTSATLPSLPTSTTARPRWWTSCCASPRCSGRTRR